LTVDPGGNGHRDEARTYPLNCWYVAATSAEVSDSLLARVLLGRPVVLYRQASGALAALEDLCPHRSMPLSHGRLDRDRVICGYHGFEFASTGDCVRVPSQTNVPYGARVRSFPVREVAPVVWIWMGDPDRAAGVDPPELPWLDHEDYTVFGGAFQVDADYLALHDNSLDMTHFPYVHGSASPAGYRTTPPPLDVAVSELSVSYSRTFPPGPLPDWQIEATGLDPNGMYVLQERGTFVSPAVHINHFDITVPSDRVGDRGGTDHQPVYAKPYVRGFTPEEVGRTHVFYWVARNYALERSEVTDHLRAVHEKLLREDKEVVELTQAHAARYGGESDLTLVNADVAAVRAHEIVSRMLIRERGGRLHARHPYTASGSR
jgi:phenylpropionate dioxygenase-like ring-hydroxylating dioxygenase large terminal subunit